MSHPLIEVRLVHWSPDTGEEGGAVTRHWYHVPRVGDQIVLPDIAGIVTSVIWDGEAVILHLSNTKENRQ